MFSRDVSISKAKDVVIVGCGGHAKVIADIILTSGDNVKGFLSAEEGIKKYLDFPVLGIDLHYEKYLDCYFIVGVGDVKIRERITNFMYKAAWYTAVHPTAVVSRMDTRIAEGTVIMANVVINPGVTIGRHCIVNTGAVLEHDDVLEDYVHVSVGSKLAGNVHVGRCTQIGIGASVKENIDICDNCLVGAGAVVISDLLQSGIYVGVPAKWKKSSEIRF